MRVFRVVVRGFLIVVCPIIALSCGVSRDNRSSLRSAYVPVSSEVEIRLPDLRYRDWSGISNYQIHEMAADVLAERLSSLGLIPSQLSEFFKFNLEISGLEGCGESSNGWYAYCPGNFSFDIRLTAEAGPDVLDDVSRRVPFTSLDRAEFRRRLDWSVKLLVGTMVQHGVLAEMHVETPYF